MHSHQVRNRTQALSAQYFLFGVCLPEQQQTICTFCNWIHLPFKQQVLFSNCDAEKRISLEADLVRIDSPCIQGPQSLECWMEDLQIQFQELQGKSSVLGASGREDMRVSGLGGGASSSIQALLLSQSSALLMQGGSCASNLPASLANFSW